MSVALEFKSAFESALSRLGEDEWATARIRDEILERLQPWEAFDAVPDVMRFLIEQDDRFTFANYCWFLSGLMRKADTTECPPGVPDLIPVLQAKALLLNGELIDEVSRVLEHFRLPANKRVQPTLGNPRAADA